MLAEYEYIAACVHNNNKDDNNKKKTRGINKRFCRGETHESKQRGLYIYQRAIALQLVVLGHDLVRKFGLL
jgi:hypothetical protein